MDNKLPGSDPRKPYGTPIPPRAELGSLLPPNFTSSPLHPMDKLNPDHPAQNPSAQRPIAAEQLVTPGPPPTRPWEQQQSATPGNPGGTLGVAAAQSQVSGAKSFRRKFIIMIVLVVSLLVAAGVLFAVSLVKKSGSTNSTSNLSVAELAKQGKLTAATVGDINARNYLQKTLTALAEQQTQRVTQEISTMAAANTRAENFLSLDSSDVTYNYKTKALHILTQHQQSETAQNPFYTTCFDGQTYLYVPTSAQQAWQTTTMQNDCDPLQATVARAISDGTNTGGLTTKQAQAFSDALFNTVPKNVLKVSQATLATHNDKQYIKVNAKITAVNVGTTAEPNWQAQTFVANAFKATGIDNANWPYYADGIASAGRTITMYIDPTTGLPAYAEYVTDTGIEDKTGKARPVTVNNTYRLVRVQYAFGGAVPKAGISQTPDAIAISWPAESR